MRLQNAVSLPKSVGTAHLKYQSPDDVVTTTDKPSCHDNQNTFSVFRKAQTLLKTIFLFILSHLERGMS